MSIPAGSSGFKWLCRALARGRPNRAARALCLPAAFLTILAAMHPVAVAAEGAMPVASAIRLAGDARQTRMIVDLDRKVGLRAFTLADPYRVVIDLPQMTFALPAQPDIARRGLIKAYRYGLVMAGGSRIVIDLAEPAKIAKAEVLAPENGQPARLVLDLDASDRASFLQAIAVRSRPATEATGSARPVPSDEAAKSAAADNDTRPVVVIDPGHGGIDNGTRAPSGEEEKEIVLAFAIHLRDHLAKGGKYRLVMTRKDDTFVPLGERVKIARDHHAALFISIHADALPRREGDARGATIYTLSEKASDAEAARLAEAENKADAIAGLDLGEKQTEVADILIDLVQRETKTFSSRFAGMLVNDLRSAARLHKKPRKSAGFRVLKAPDVPSVLVELGYVSNQQDLKLMMSEKWREGTVEAMARAVDTFFARRLAGAPN